MTVKELYEWAVKNNVENLEILVQRDYEGIYEEPINEEWNLKIDNSYDFLEKGKIIRIE